MQAISLVRERERICVASLIDEAFVSGSQVPATKAIPRKPALRMLPFLSTRCVAQSIASAIAEEPLVENWGLRHGVHGKSQGRLDIPNHLGDRLADEV